MRALLIEDNQDLASTLARVLREHGFTVNCSHDGADGLFEATRFKYDVVILDMLLPEKPGQVVLEKLRQISDVPVLVITAIDDVQDRVAALNSGADDYLVKPFDLEEFVARARTLIRRSKHHSVPKIKIKSIEVDTLTRRVTKDGDVVHLTPREYSLLEVIISNRGQVVSRADIYYQLLDDDDDADRANLVDVHMSHLRRKLGPGLIRTVRGSGYIIDVD